MNFLTINETIRPIIEINGIRIITNLNEVSQKSISNRYTPRRIIDTIPKKNGIPTVFISSLSIQSSIR
jgi:hypothetical protein